MFDPLSFRGVVIICGHYGVGKTNLSLNLACDLLAAGRAVRLVDLDIVNPYFRSSDYTEVLASRGGETVSPVLANTTLDVPSLSAGVMGAIAFARADDGNVALVDVGGDDAGATALGRFAPIIAEGPYEMIYVVNSRRSQTRSVQEALEILHEVERASGLRASALFGNDHLFDETDADIISAGVRFAQDCAERAQLPLVGFTVPKQLANSYVAEVWAGEAPANLYPVDKIVTTPWETPRV